MSTGPIPKTATMTAALAAGWAEASPIDSKQTFVLQRDDIKFPLEWFAAGQRRDG
jgi:hypothetical protein